LEPHSQTDDTPQSRSILEGQLRECYGRVVYSHKTHEKCADILLYRLAVIRTLQILLSGLTTAGFIGAVFEKGRVSTVLGLIVSTLLLALNAFTKDNDNGALAQKHRNTGNDLWLIRERFCSLLVNVAMKEKPLEDLQMQRDELIEQLHAAYSAAPSTTSKAYKQAQKALQKNEDMTFSDAEIDAFLPRELKRSSRAHEVLNRELEKILPKTGEPPQKPAPNQSE
jgi:hypothetical protein